MTECPRHDHELLARLEHEGRKGVPQIVEPLPWQPGPCQCRLERVGDVRPVERRSVSAREDERGGTNHALTSPMLEQGRRDCRPERERPLRSLRLRLGQCPRATLEGVADRQRARLEVDVLSAKREQLALP